MRTLWQTVKEYRSFLIWYTSVFVFLVFVVFSSFFLSGRTFIWYADGLTQHYNALIFCGEHLRTVLRTVFVEHSLNIPSWSFSIGEGGDILTVLNYYAIGDPLCLLSVFFDEHNMYVLYDAIVILRLYLSGLTFAYLCKQTGRTDTASVLPGAISYVFCFWAVFNCARHPMFLIPMVMMPLFIAGAEKILKGDRPYVLFFSVLISAVSSFYFFYMMAILTVIYTAVRVFTLYGKDCKKIFKGICRMLLYSVTAVMASGTIFLPVLYTYASDSRNSGINSIRLLYPEYYYLSLAGTIVAPNEMFWLCLSLTSTVIISLVVLFTCKRKYLTLKILCIITAVFIAVPFFGQLLNGMSYMSNRWCFAAILLSSFTLVTVNDLMISRKEIYTKITPVIVSVLLVWVILSQDVKDADVICALLIMVLFAITMYILIRKGTAGSSGKAAVTVFTALSVAASSFFLFSPLQGDYVSETRTPEQIEKYYDDDGIAAQALLSGEEGFYRYSGRGLQMNSSLNRGVSSTFCYWSLTNPYSIEFNEALALSNYLIHENSNYDNRTILTGLASVLYYMVPEDQQAVLYGYEEVNDVAYEGHKIYRNNEPVGICFVQDGVIDRSLWDELSPSLREEALLYGAVVSDDDSIGLPHIIPELNSVRSDYTLEYDESQISVDDDGTINVLSSGATLRLVFNGNEDSETHLFLDDIVLEDLVNATIAVKSSSGVIDYVELHEDGFSYYNGRHDFVLNLGYSEEPCEWILLYFADAGRYSLSNMEVWNVPMGDYSGRIEEMNRTGVTETDITTDRISLNVSEESERMLVFTIPYSDGWKAYMDGQQIDLHRVDVKYMGLVLPEGEHHIDLVYNTPYFKAGMVLSLAGFMAFAAEIVSLKKKRVVSSS